MKHALEKPWVLYRLGMQELYTTRLQPAPVLAVYLQIVVILWFDLQEKQKNRLCGFESP
jgi:hypothetical protein